jgi:biopolymer transport protein TolR
MIPFLPSRNELKASPRHRAEVELNLIPLIDILSVMVAFLLVYTTNVEVVQNAKGVEIPQSSAEVQPKQSVVVMITKEQLFVQNELIATIAEIRESKDPLIEPLRAVLERPLLVDETLAARTEELAIREITVLADKSLPYEVVKKVMSTCTAASYGKISLAVIEKETPLDAAALNTA